ncbi:MAG: transposase [Planctomycetota bacterium]
MRKNERSECRQAYNAQAAVDTDGAQLVLAAGVTECASDANQLLLAVEVAGETQGKPEAVLADTGYVNTDALQELAEVGIDAYVAVSSEQSHTRRTYEFRPRKERRHKKIASPVLLDMKKGCRPRPAGGCMPRGS